MLQSCMTREELSLAARYYNDHLRRLESYPPPQRLPSPATPVTEARSGLYPDAHSQAAFLMTAESLPPPERVWPCPVARQPRRNVSFRRALPVSIAYSADHDLPACPFSIREIRLALHRHGRCFVYLRVQPGRPCGMRRPDYPLCEARSSRGLLHNQLVCPYWPDRP